MAGPLMARRIGLLLGPALFALMLYFRPLPLAAGGNEAIAVALWMLTWLISEAVPLAVAALLPIVLFSLTGVMPLDEALRPYSSKIVYLFFGGFMIALGLETHGLHKRMALLIIGAVGLSPPRLILGFTVSTALLSMWISNTATAVMMLPMALSCLGLLCPTGSTEGASEGPPAKEILADDGNFATALILSIAFAANIGGMGTVIGTPPNLVMRGYFESVLGIQISFFSWMLWAMPIVVVLLAATYVLLAFVLFPCHRVSMPNAAAVFRAERSRLGPMTGADWRMLAVFVVTALLWMFSGLIKPWLPNLPLTDKPIPLSDEIIAVAAAIALFVVPGDRATGRALLDWEATKRLPWGILLLFGGGLSLASALEKTGVIQSLSDLVEAFGGGHVVLVLVLLTAVSLYLTELMSNVALVQVLIPVICGVALGLNVDPLIFAFPATLASSCAFMLPMATPPNAIVFATGRLTVWQMVKAGFWLNLIALAIILLLSQPLLRLFHAP